MCYYSLITRHDYIALQHYFYCIANSSNISMDFNIYSTILVSFDFTALWNSRCFFLLSPLNLRSAETTLTFYFVMMCMCKDVV